MFVVGLLPDRDVTGILIGSLAAVGLWTEGGVLGGCNLHLCDG